MKESSSAVPAGEAFIESFSEMTRSMLAQSRALSRKVSLAQLLEDSCTTNTNTKSENTESASANALGDQPATASTRPQSGLGAASANAGSAREKVLKDLRSLDTIVSELELRAAAAREAIDRERRGCSEIEELRAAARQRAEDIAAVCLALPQYLPHAAPPSPMPAALAAEQGGSSSTITTAGVVASRSAAVGAAAGTGEGKGTCRMVPMLELVTMAELEAVPKSTRVRLTIAQVNSAVTEIQKAMERR